jgi:nitroreductase
MDVVDAIHSWRTVRSFHSDAVQRSEIADLLWHAVQVSTPPQNDTPWAFCVLEGVDRIARLGEQAIEFARQNRPLGEPGWNWVDRPGFKVFWDAPVIILISAQVGNGQAIFDCHRAGQNLVLAAHARGFGSCWLGAPLPWLRSTGVAVELGVPLDFEPSVVIALGRPTQPPQPKSRPRPKIVWHSDG